MKKGLFVILLSLCCLFSFGQTKNEAIVALQIGLVEVNDQLPITSLFFTLEKMEVVGNDLVVHTTIDEDQMDLDRYLENLNQNKSNLFALVGGNNNDFVRLFKKTGLNLKYVVKGSNSKRQGTVVITAEEIDNSSNIEYSALDFLKESVEQMQDDIPQDWGNGLTLTSAFIEDGYFCYGVTTDETVMTMPLLKLSKALGSEIEDGFVEEMASMTGLAERLFVSYLKQSGLGIKYIFRGKDPTDTVTFVVTHEMLEKGIDY